MFRQPIKRSIVGFTTKLSIMLSFVVLLSSCGFHLRGDYLINDQLKTLYISSSDPYGELTRLVKQHFQRNHIKVLNQPDIQYPQLTLLKDKLDRRALSVFNNGQVAEYELIYSVKYQLIMPDREPLSFSFELNRDYQDDPDNSLAKSRELALLLRELRLQAADRILRSMSTVSSQQ
jgi:LPS-assembly lipoprotein